MSSLPPKDDLQIPGPPSPLLHTTRPPLLESPFIYSNPQRNPQPKPQRRPQPIPQPIPEPKSSKPSIPSSDEAWKSSAEAWKTLYEIANHRCDRLEKSLGALQAQNTDLTKQLAQARLLLQTQHDELTRKITGQHDFTRHPTVIELKILKAQNKELMRAWFLGQRSNDQLERTVTTEIRVLVEMKSGDEVWIHTSFDLRTTTVGMLRQNITSSLKHSGDPVGIAETTNWCTLWARDTAFELDDDYVTLNSLGLVNWMNLRGREMDWESKFNGIITQERGKYIHVSACLGGQIRVARFGGSKRQTVGDLKRKVAEAFALDPEGFKLGFGGTELKDAETRLEAFGPPAWYLSVWETGEPCIFEMPKFQFKAGIKK